MRVAEILGAQGVLSAGKVASRQTSANVMLVTLLIPVTALLLGSLLLDEAVATTALAGMALIFGGLLAIDGRLPGARLVIHPLAASLG